MSYEVLILSPTKNGCYAFWLTLLEQIANYLGERLTSSFVEGFNNRVKLLKRRCYGIFDVDRLFQRLTLDIHGYERFSHLS